MRLPLTPQISTKDGTTNKNARLFNMLQEKRKTGDLAVIRPSLQESSTYTGIGSGLIVFDGRLLVAFGDTVHDGSAYLDLDAPAWSASEIYGWGDGVFYLGQWWGATDVNQNQTPLLNSSHWRSIIEIYDWDGSETYGMTQGVIEDGVTYYSRISANSGNQPSISPTQWTTTRPNPAYTVANVAKTPTNISLGQTQTCTYDIQLNGVTVSSGSGSYATSLNGSIASATATNWPTTSAGGTLGHSIAVYQAKPTAPPDTIFSGSTSWSGLPGWDNFAWSPTQSGGAWGTVA